MDNNRSVSLGEALRYRGKMPMLTYILHRIGGISLVLFLGLRILIPFLVRQPQSAAAGIIIGSVFSSWPFQVYIIFFVLFHVINGLRIVILDLWPELIEHQRAAIWIECAVFLPIWGALMYMIVRTGLEVEMDLKNASQRGVNFDYIMWVFTRLSALAMYLLILITILAVIIIGARQNMTLPDLVRWIFSPVVGRGSNAKLLRLATQETLFWKGLGFLFILLAGSHGFHGILSVEEDYLPKSHLRKPLRYLIFILWIILSIISAYVILTS